MATDKAYTNVKNKRAFILDKCRIWLEDVQTTYGTGVINHIGIGYLTTHDAAPEYPSVQIYAGESTRVFHSYKQVEETFRVHFIVYVNQQEDWMETLDDTLGRIIDAFDSDRLQDDTDWIVDHDIQDIALGITADDIRGAAGVGKFTLYVKFRYTLGGYHQ